MVGMKNEIAQQLFDLNGQFYQSFGKAFAETRRRIQPGVRRVLSEWVSDGAWLDLGCGSGALSVEWAKQGLSGSYLGVDFSHELLDEAQKSIASLAIPADLKIEFSFANLAADTWAEGIAAGSLDGVLAFASLHHIPAEENRLRILRSVRELLKPQGVFIHSEWQFQHSVKLMARVKPWSSAGIDPCELEEGDTLLDWRHAATGQAESEGLRYVHLFSGAELERLAAASGFTIEQEFVSDGSGERLGLYQLWRKR